MFRKDFENMTISEIEAIWLEDIKSFGVDGCMDLLTPWDYRILVRELLGRLHQADEKINR